MLLVEMTGSYALVLPLVTASLVAHADAEATCGKPIYELLLDRELERRRGLPPTALEGATPEREDLAGGKFSRLILRNARQRRCGTVGAARLGSTSSPAWSWSAFVSAHSRPLGCQEPAAQRYCLPSWQLTLSGEKNWFAYMHWLP
ncbi:MAG: hypothetical protein DMF95_32445 [Acidobacteria bacterium]|nr:MAG: hypothetical protein DMF95_32445 [Acidobacteriota bacterium]